MKLNRREDITITSWINDKLISNSDWQVFGEFEDDNLFLSVQEPNTNNQLKIKITKTTKHEDAKENQ